MSEKEKTSEATLIDPKDTAIYRERGIKLLKSYDELIKQVKTMLSTELSNILKMRWRLGAHVKAMVEGAAYGDSTVDKMAEDLGMSRSNLYSCKRVFETFTEDDINQKFIKAGIGFKSAIFLATIQETETRDQWLDKLAKGEVKESDLPEITKNEGMKQKVAEASAANAEPSLQEKSTETGPIKSADKKACDEIRKAVAHVEAALDDALVPALLKLEKALPRMGDIADDTVYDNLLGRIQVLHVKMTDTRDQMDEQLKELAKLNASEDTVK